MVLVFVLDVVKRDAVIARKQPHNFIRGAPLKEAVASKDERARQA
jgi:hypothetical protein